MEPWIDVARRQDFKLIFDVRDGNPNGDPDAGNLPRVDPETMHGLVTDVAIKRKVRNWVDATRGGQAPWRIYVQNRGIALNTLHKEAYEGTGTKSTGSRQRREDIERVRPWMCEQFFDIRTFGAVMTTEVNCGQVRGPVQITMARSIEPIVPWELSITRVAITKPQDAVAVHGSDDEAHGKTTEMGRKAIVPYAVYEAMGSVSPLFAEETGFSSGDLQVLWEALERMWDLDRSAARGQMNCRGLYVFSHTSRFGDAPSHKLLERVRVVRGSQAGPTRRFEDYQVLIEDVGLPKGVSMHAIVQ